MEGLGFGAVADRGEVEQETTRSEPAEQEARAEPAKLRTTRSELAEQEAGAEPAVLKTPTVEQTGPKIPMVEKMTTSVEPMVQGTTTADQAGLEQRA